jgi:hypothetical protein
VVFAENRVLLARSAGHKQNYKLEKMGKQLIFVTCFAMTVWDWLRYSKTLSQHKKNAPTNERVLGLASV